MNLDNIFKLVMQDKNITIQGKAIYAYFYSCDNSGTTSFPPIEQICIDLGISKNTYNKHFKILKEHGYIKPEQYTDKTQKKVSKSFNSDTNTKDRPTDILSIKTFTKSLNTLDNYNAYKQILQENMMRNNYLNFPNELEFVDEIIEIMLDVVMSKSDTIKINGELKSREIVKNIYFKLNYKHLSYAIDRFNSVNVQINNKKAYLTSILFNSFYETTTYNLNVNNVVRNGVL